METMRPSVVVAHRRLGILLGCSLLLACGQSGPPALTVSVPSPAHQYTASLPTDWTSSLGSGPADPDTFSGPQGKVTAVEAVIPEGQPRDAWADFYADARTSEFGASCFGGGGTSADAVQVGQETGYLRSVPCISGWIVIVTHGEHGYDFRFANASGSQSDAGKALFESILRGITFQ